MKFRPIICQLCGKTGKESEMIASGNPFYPTLIHKKCDELKRKEVKNITDMFKDG